MRILWVKAGKLLPVDTGGKIRSYNLLRQLAARHETVPLTSPKLSHVWPKSWVPSHCSLRLVRSTC